MSRVPPLSTATHRVIPVCDGKASGVGTFALELHSPCPHNAASCHRLRESDEKAAAPSHGCPAAGDRVLRGLAELGCLRDIQRHPSQGRGGPGAQDRSPERARLPALAAADKIAQLYVPTQSGPTSPVLAERLKREAVERLVGNALENVVTPYSLLLLVSEGGPLKAGVERLLRDQMGRADAPKKVGPVTTLAPARPAPSRGRQRRPGRPSEGLSSGRSRRRIRSPDRHRRLPPSPATGWATSRASPSSGPSATRSASPRTARHRPPTPSSCRVSPASTGRSPPSSWPREAQEAAAMIKSRRC